MPTPRIVIASIALHLVASVHATAFDRVPWLLKQLRDPTSRHVMVVAHRGDWHEAPENSLAGMRHCIDMGVDVIEIDIRRTKDGRFVVIHDKDVDRTTTGTGRVDELTFEQIRELRLREKSGAPTDERVPSIEEVIDLARGKVLVYLDKTDDMIDQLHEVVAKNKAESLVLFYGKWTRPQLDERYRDLVGRITYLPKLGDDTPSAKQYVEALAPLKPPAFILDFAKEDSQALGLIPRIRESGARIWASPLWPEAAAGRTDELALVDPDANWGWLLKRGVTMICTDRPRELLEYLNRQGLRESPAPVAASGSPAEASR